MGCSDNWARDNADQEEIRDRREKQRMGIGVTASELINEEIRITMRERRYFNQFIKVVELLTDEQLEKQILNDKEFRDLFMQLQDSKRVAGLDWIECKFNDKVLLTPWLEVTLVKHKGLNYSV